MWAIFPLLVSSVHAQHLLSVSSSSTFLELQPALYQPSTEFPADLPMDWGSLPGAKWIWTEDSFAAGPFTFFATFIVSERALAEMRSVKLWIIVDDEFRVSLNGKKLVREWQIGLWKVELELKPWVVGYEVGRERENLLEIEAVNRGGPGSLVYAVIGYT